MQVVGVPDARYGEEIAAFVIVRTSGTVDTEAVREFCRGKIAHFKIPRYVMEVDEFPMTVTGKSRNSSYETKQSSGLTCAAQSCIRRRRSWACRLNGVGTDRSSLSVLRLWRSVGRDDPGAGCRDVRVAADVPGEAQALARLPHTSVRRRAPGPTSAQSR